MKNRLNSNIFYTFFTQIITIIIGIVIPKLILVNYGSEVNGLFNTVNQIYSYVALLEAGIGGACIQGLYRPIVESNRKGVSEILVATQRYYRKIARIYLICVIIISFLFSVFVSTSINSVTLFIFILLQGVSNIIIFYYIAALKQLLVADGKSYVMTNIAFFIFLITSLSRVVLVNFRVNIIFIQIAYLLINIIQIIFYQFYLKRNYRWIKWDIMPNYKPLEQRNDFLKHEISGVIFSSTDTIILAVFCDLKVASVYAIYNLIFSNISSLIASVFNSIKYNLGFHYHSDKEKYYIYHEFNEKILICVVFVLFTCCYLLITPFIKFYTQGINDVVYVDKYLPILFTVSAILSNIRLVSNNLIGISNCAGKTVKRAYLEAALNLSTSIILVNFIGLYGVLIGTIVALLYRTNDVLIYSNKTILKRKLKDIYSIIVINILLFGLICFIGQYIKIEVSSFYVFLLIAFIIFCFVTIIYTGALIIMLIRSKNIYFNKIVSNLRRK